MLERTRFSSLSQSPTSGIPRPVNQRTYLQHTLYVSVRVTSETTWHIFSPKSIQSKIYETNIIVCSVNVNLPLVGSQA